MKYDVLIQRLADGETRTYHDDADYEVEEMFDFMWFEGNYSCDCNRALFFARAGGDDDMEADIPCGETRFAVVNKIPATP